MKYEPDEGWVGKQGKTDFLRHGLLIRNLWTLQICHH